MLHKHLDLVGRRLLKGETIPREEKVCSLFEPHTQWIRKGKRNAAEAAEEHQADYIELRHAHSAVESNINSLEHHGLDRCPDKGFHGYQRTTGLGVIAYNLNVAVESLDDCGSVAGEDGPALEDDLRLRIMGVPVVINCTSNHGMGAVGSPVTVTEPWPVGMMQLSFATGNSPSWCQFSS